MASPRARLKPSLSEVKTNIEALSNLFLTSFVFPFIETTPVKCLFSIKMRSFSAYSPSALPHNSTLHSGYFELIKANASTKRCCLFTGATLPTHTITGNLKSLMSPYCGTTFGIYSICLAFKKCCTILLYSGIKT